MTSMGEREIFGSSHYTTVYVLGSFTVDPSYLALCTVVYSGDC